MRILLATDGSPNAKDAAKVLLRLHATDQIKLTVLSVTYPGSPEWDGHEREMVQSHHEELSELFDGRFASLSMFHRKGHVSQTILNLAKTIDADLIVMGAVGHSMISRMMLGSISDDVATRANCSVLIVRPAKEETTTIDSTTKITVAYDDSPPSRHAIDELLDVNWGPGASIDILTVLLAQYDYFIGDGLSPVVLQNEEETYESMRDSARRASEKLSELIPNAHSLTVRGMHIGESIVQHAIKNGTDLIVVGDASHGMLHHLLIGNTAKYVMRHAPCSVWISRQHHLYSEPKKPTAEKVAAT